MGGMVRWPLKGKCKHRCCIELGTKYLLKMFHLFKIYIYIYIYIYIHTELRIFIWKYEGNISTEWSMHVLEDNFF
jgi:hypothetical protein